MRGTMSISKIIAGILVIGFTVFGCQQQQTAQK